MVVGYSRCGVRSRYHVGIGPYVVCQGSGEKGMVVGYSRCGVRSRYHGSNPGFLPAPGAAESGRCRHGAQSQSSASPPETQGGESTHINLHMRRIQTSTKRPHIRRAHAYKKNIPAPSS